MWLNSNHSACFCSLSANLTYLINKGVFNHFSVLLFYILWIFSVFFSLRLQASGLNFERLGWKIRVYRGRFLVDKSVEWTGSRLEGKNISYEIHTLIFNHFLSLLLKALRYTNSKQVLEAKLLIWCNFQCFVNHFYHGFKVIFENGVNECLRNC